jgi:hypothetical protein
VRILDFPHGAQRLGDVAEAVWGGQEAGRTPPPANLPAASVAAPAPRVRQPPSPALPHLGPKTIVNGRPTARHPWKRFSAVQLPPSAKL